ncbi:hypothetical protein J3Q64DRAFT_1701585 [Phycomyces blakesleeanus]|uniref:C2H2-type domain-containing protein n=2 Tax=Phycomyces blakesleeanus TaxID=4837 RepID=A0ABR3AQF6_PHYBL
MPMNIFADPTYDILTTSLPQLQYPADTSNRQRQPSISSTNSDKIYSFVALPGTTQKKRPRRRFDEVERLYFCSWPECTKAYGTLNHLNAHVSMQNHGPKRHPAEFKEMRKEWRRQKKEREAMRKSAEKEYSIYGEPFAVHYPQNFYPSF